LNFRAEVGVNNLEQKFFVIQQEGTGRGLFSLLSAVICYLDFADKNSLIPVVDFENYRNIYNEKNYINSTLNSFEYYFHPVSPYSLDDVYTSNNFLVSDRGYPKGYNYTIANISGLFSVFSKYIRLKEDISVQVDEFIDEKFSSPILGVHYRGKEMRTAAGHRYPPSSKQILYSIDKSMSNFGYKKIFISSEDESLIEVVDKTFPGIVFYNKNYYRSSGNAYKEYPRANHLYRLGLEVLIDMFALSKCDSLISCASNVAWFARFVNNGKYKSHIFINNGPNFKFYPLYKISWYVKKILPEYLGGFKTNACSLQETIKNSNDTR
jgi:hypothetical protein